MASSTGHDAEQLAKQYLLDNSLQFLEQNYRVKVGEIDLIMLDKQQLVFVEVKFRSTNTYGCAAEYFTFKKRKRLERAINCYLLQNKMNTHHTNLRIDVVAIDGEQVNWIKNV
ncbi:MAG: YraN family protein [Glaciecola sp.]|jgi:putative endonuclease